MAEPAVAPVPVAEPAPATGPVPTAAPIAAEVNGAGPVKSALRTVELLEFFAGHRGLHSLAELQQSLGYPKSSLYMLLRTLTDLGWVETDPTGTLYGIGLRALLVGTSYLDGDHILTAAKDTLDWLAETTTETVHLARLDGTDVVYLATRESQHYLRPISRVGRRLPAHTTSLGKALLAERTDAEVRAMLPVTLSALTPHTLVDHDALAADLRATRERGYSVDREENVLGLRCFGVALRYQRPARDAISCSVPVARLTEGRQEQIAGALLAARDRLERILR
ncbi:IclR family transcriptional regulator [Rugosimonospora africana]|uniref:Glycerol operon regulatory protein n=1 Tax=Rugosimonospora africana TaxID=556532 RepID=A0A8J3QRS1_9ACTN|nr:IclR family transcriptional regulator [Rugosimonospora africana]GIH14662.1 IclR family transcriptional regulator [Rugosimonospora africana]